MEKAEKSKALKVGVREGTETGQIIWILLSFCSMVCSGAVCDSTGSSDPFANEKGLNFNWLLDRKVAGGQIYLSS